MVKQLWVTEFHETLIGGYITRSEATQADIVEAAGVTKLRQQRDALLAAAKLASPVFNNPEENYFADYVKAAKAIDDAIALCEPKEDG